MEDEWMIRSYTMGLELMNLRLATSSIQELRWSDTKETT